MNNKIKNTFNKLILTNLDLYLMDMEFQIEVKVEVEDDVQVGLASVDASDNFQIAASVTEEVEKVASN